MAGTIERYQRAISDARAAGDEEAARFMERELANATQQYSATDGMGALEQGWANLGAGYHTFGEGAAQLAGGGPSDEELRRSRAEKEALAKQSDLGILPDWVPTMGSAMQVIGEAAPTAIPVGGTAVGLGRLAAKVLPKALAKGAPNIIARTGQAAARSPMLAGAAGGAAGGAVMPVTSEESRGENVFWSAAGGTLLPVGAATYRGVRQLASPERRAGKVLKKALEREGLPAEEVAQKLDIPAGRIPMTAAQRTGSAELGALERDLSAKDAAKAANFLRAQNKAVYDTLDEQTKGRLDYEALEAARDTQTKPMREAAMSSASRWTHVARPLNAYVDDLVAHSPARSPRRYLAGLANDVLKENPSPEQLYEFRHMLVKKLDGPSSPNDQEAAIIKGARRETMKLVDAIDARLNEASDGLYEEYMTRYRAMSKPVDEAVALKAVWDKIDAPGQAVTRLADDTVPHVTRHGLRQAMKESEGAFGERLQPTAQRQLKATMRKLQQIEEPGRTIRGASTYGGGSDTYTRFMQAARGKFGNLGRATPILQGAFEKLDQAEQEALITMLREPEQAAKAIRVAVKAGKPMTPAQQALLAITSQAGASAIVGAQQ